MSRRRATGAPKDKRPEHAPIDALALKEEVQAKLRKTTKGMTSEEERAFHREATRTGPLAGLWARADAATKARAEAQAQTSAQASQAAPASLGGEKKSVQTPSFDMPSRLAGPTSPPKTP